MKQRLLVELAPAQLLLPHSDGMELLLTAGLVARVLCGTPGLARAERTDAQGSTQIRGAGGAREITVGFVAKQRTITEAGELRQGRRFSGATGADLGALEPMAVPQGGQGITCLLYTSPSPRDRTRSRMPSSA